MRRGQSRPRRPAAPARAGWPGRLRRQASIEASAAGSGSLGCQSSCGNRPAKKAACSPVPLAISSTSPRSRQHLAKHRGDRLRGCARSARAACAASLRRLGPVRLLVDQHRLARRQGLVEPAPRRVDRAPPSGSGRRPWPARRRERSAPMNWSSAALLSVSVGSTSIAPWTTSGKYMVIGWKPSSISPLARSSVVRPPAKPLSLNRASCMHGPLVAERRVEHVLQAAQDVIGVEHRILRTPAAGRRRRG